jgi:hypothetical protein
MAATIKIKNSSTANAKPTSSDLVQGELAINVTDKKIFTEDSGGNVVELGANFNGFKNRIINGAMVIDQRNAGASITPTNGQFLVDRFNAYVPQASKFTSQQSSTAPTDFVKSLLITSSSAYTVGSSESFAIQQVIEGYNIADLNWGTANAKTVTLSFWVRSSLTGTFGGAVQNYASDRSYPFSYTISSANTWEQKSVTIAGDTSGTWLTTNSGGMALIFSIGTGATKSGTAGSWGSTYYTSATGATSVVGTNGATFYITGVQLEKGSTATSFDYRPYGTELALCQRYLPAYNVENSNNTPFGTTNQGSNTTRIWTSFQFPVATRTAPTGATISSVSHFIGAGQNTNFTISALNFSYASRLGAEIFFDGSGGTSQQAVRLISQNASGQILFTGCEL